MRTQSYFFIGLIVILVILSIGTLVIGTNKAQAPAPEQIVTPTPEPVTPPPPTPAPAATTTVSSNSDLINVSAPLANAKVTSPLLVKGQARGTWFFEASFPVKLIDAKGVTLAQTAA